MPKFATVAKHVGMTVLAIFLAGLTMNALRNMPLVKQAIDGYDG